MVKYIFGFLAILIVFAGLQECVRSCSAESDRKERSKEAKKYRENEKQISKSIDEALANNDFEKAKALDENKTHIGKILETEIKYLISLNSPESAKRLAYKIMEHPCLKVAHPTDGFHEVSRVLNEFSKNREQIEKANEWLDGLLDVAIIEKNEAAAQVILLKYLDNLRVDEGPKTIVKNGKTIKLRYSDYYLSYSKDSYQRALTKYKEAKELW